MNRQNLKLLFLCLVVSAFSLISVAAEDETSSQSATTMGPGMMMGRGNGMGPGMMTGGGYGMGPGMMMGGGYGMGPGMMMGGGYGMGPGMMMGGGYGMGPAMMGGWGYSMSNVLKLSDKQLEKIQNIRESLGEKQWSLMQTMHNEMISAYKNRSMGEDIDVDAIMKAQTALSDLHLQMLRNRLEAQKKIQDVLTKEQRGKLAEMYGWGR